MIHGSPVTSDRIASIVAPIGTAMAMAAIGSPGGKRFTRTLDSARQAAAATSASRAGDRHVQAGLVAEDEGDSGGGDERPDETRRPKPLDPVDHREDHGQERDEGGDDRSRAGRGRTESGVQEDVGQAEVQEPEEDDPDQVLPGGHRPPERDHDAGQDDAGEREPERRTPERRQLPQADPDGDRVGTADDDGCRERREGDRIRAPGRQHARFTRAG